MLNVWRESLHTCERSQSTWCFFAVWVWNSSVWPQVEWSFASFMNFAPVLSQKWMVWDTTQAFPNSTGPELVESYTGIIQLQIHYVMTLDTTQTRAACHYPFTVLGAYTYQRCLAKMFKKSVWHHWKEHPRISHPPCFHTVESPTAVILHSVATMTAVGGSTSHLRTRTCG